MPAWLHYLLLASTTALLIPVAVLCIECLAALLPPRTRANPVPGIRRRPRLAILIPAHNEEVQIERTLETIWPQLWDADRVIVICDNCTDTTADKARAAGAEVIERQDPDNRGKGFALDFGLRSLAENPPEIVVMIDADCVVHDRAIDELLAEADALGRPSQAVYLLSPSSSPASRDGISVLAFMVKNLVRPRGLDRLGLPCLLVGTGMAFTWESIRSAPLANGNIVEDMQLGLELAIAGHAPRFCPWSRVSGELPERAVASLQQRRRWEHGHIHTLITQVPRLGLAALRQGRIDLLGLMLELAVPPLSLLVMLLMGFGLLMVVPGFHYGYWTPFHLVVAGAVAMNSCVLLAWLRFGRKVLPARSLARIPLYVLWKIPIYLSFLFNRQRDWNRTERPAAR